MQRLGSITNTVFVLFIDGLDECDPAEEHGGLVNALKGLSRFEDIKVCVSSRPWKPFSSHFGQLTSCIHLHELTSAEIAKFIVLELSEAEVDGGITAGIFLESESSTTVDEVSWETPQGRWASMCATLRLHSSLQV